MNIVVRSPNWIGDCVMAIPAIRALKYWFSDSTLTLVAKTRLLDIFKNFKEIDTLIPLSDRDNFRTLISDGRKLRPFHFDAGILFTNSFRSALLFKLARVRNLVGYGHDWRGWLLGERMPFPVNSRHHRFFYLDLVEYFVTLHFPGSRFEDSVFSDALPVDDLEKKTVENRLESEGINPKRKLIGISPSAAYGSSKEWLPDRFGELIERLVKRFSDSVVLLFGSRKEMSRVERIAECFQRDVHNLAGRFSLRESLIAMSSCALFISNDSGLMHVASSLRVPVIGIFGPTDPHKTAPFNRESRILFHTVHCSPCKHRVCPVDHICMKAVEVDEVYAAASEILLDGAGDRTREKIEPGESV